MATPAQCFYCFEVLAAAFQGAEAPRLASLDILCEMYKKIKLGATLTPDEQPGNPNDNTELGKFKLQAPSVVRLQHEELVAQSSNMTSAEALVSQQQQHGQEQQQGQQMKEPEPETPASASSARSRRSTTKSRHSSVASAESEKVTQSGAISGTPVAPNIMNETLAVEWDASFPLFVTWYHLTERNEKRLRGCIGTFEPQQLELGLNVYCIQAAFHDPRFMPINEELMGDLACSITLLADFERCANPLDWDLDTHGIRISFRHPNAEAGRKYTATYLPDVAREQGWSKEETLESLMQKAGWEDPDPDARGLGRLRGRLASAVVPGAGPASTTRPWEKVAKFKVTRYKGLKASATFDEWEEFRAWVEADEARRRLLYAER